MRNKNIISFQATTTAAAVKLKEKKQVKKAEKKLNDPRSDPIPKPPMFPTSRPPRGQNPPRAIHNSSLGVASALNDVSSSSRGESVLGVSPSLAASCPALSGRDSVDSGHSDVIQVDASFRLQQWTTSSFDLPPEGSAKKENKLDFLKPNTYFVFISNVLALFTFYTLPSGGKSKGEVVHSAVTSN